MHVYTLSIALYLVIYIARKAIWGLRMFMLCGMNVDLKVQPKAMSNLHTLIFY